jgi:hypothetical protein
MKTANQNKHLLFNALVILDSVAVSQGGKGLFYGEIE